MKTLRTSSAVVATLACILATGCAHFGHHKTVTPPPQPPPATNVDANGNPLPPPKPAVQTPPPAPPPAPAPEPAPAEDTNAAQPVHHHKAKPSPATPLDQSSTATPAPTTGGETPKPAETPATTVAHNDQPEGASPIGQLSAGDEENSGALRTQTLDLLASNDRHLHSIHRSLSTDEQHTVAQVKKFQQQARQALAGQDLHAANTLATKAKLLLDELLK